MSHKFFKGPIFHTSKLGELNYHKEAIIEVDENGVIAGVYDEKDTNYPTKLTQAQSSKQLVELEEGQYFLPGFIDLHIHAPQWPQAGIALDKPLNVWLDQHTFPLEAKYSDIDFARTVYSDLVDQLLSRGTTTGLYFATIHVESSLELARICAKKGQRALVGKVVMDDKEENPDFYRDESTERALKDMEEFIIRLKEEMKDVKQGVYPVVTPRFVPSCTDQALAGCGELAHKYNTHVQSHCSEGDWQHNFVIDRFNGKRDTEVLRDFGLLGPKSVMAHSVFLNEADGEIFKETNTAVGHCPISNAYFANAVAPVKRLLDQGVTVGLGTDISGGFSPSLYDNVKQAVISSRMLQDGVDIELSSPERGVDDSRLSMVEAFYLVTTGGGEALDLPIGDIRPGHACDLQVIDVKHSGNKLPEFGIFDEAEDILERILYLSTPDNIRQVYVQGDLVVNKDK